MTEKFSNEIVNSPRLYIDAELAENITLPLDDKAGHYLKNVLRRADGSPLRVFNGRDGEFLAHLSFNGKKAVLEINHRTRQQIKRRRDIHLIFAPIKKDRLDFLIEKAVELGVTHLHPVLTRQTSVRDINEGRVMKQIHEACEQCERLDIPELSRLSELENFLTKWPEAVPLYAALERSAAPLFGGLKIRGNAGILIGPEGGFSAEEKTLLLQSEKITPVSLGDNILRAETAAIFGLSLMASLNNLMSE